MQVNYYVVKFSIGCRHARRHKVLRTAHEKVFIRVPYVIFFFGEVLCEGFLGYDGSELRQKVSSSEIMFFFSSPDEH